MDTPNIENQTKKVKKKSRGKAIAISIFLVFPVVIIALLYSNNKNFENTINKMLTKMPGVVGEYFRKAPTESEKSEKVNYLANYFIKLDSNSASDKVYIIKKDDEKLFFDLIREMNSISPTKTEEIVLNVRNIELRKDLLVSAYDEAQEDEKSQFLSEVSRIETQNTLTTVLEIEKKFSSREFLKVLDEIRNDKIGEILYYTDFDIRAYILDTFDSDKRTIIESIIYQKTTEENKLVDIAKLYETKSIDAAIKAIGDTQNYSMDKLGTIYKNLSVIRSAELLSNIKDEQFIEELFTAIMREEELTKSDTNITRDISKAMEFINEYQSKIKDLVVIYEKMSPEKVARIIERMMDNNTTITSIELNVEEVYELSDRVIIIDVLSKMKNQTLSKVFDFMEADKASQVTQLLARPSNN